MIVQQQIARLPVDPHVVVDTHLLQICGILQVLPHKQEVQQQPLSWLSCSAHFSIALIPAFHLGNKTHWAVL